MTNSDLRYIIGDTVHKAEPTAKAILFGSRARGDAHESSDWDVLVIVDTPKVTDELFKALSYDLWEKGLDMGEEINPIIYTRKQWENAPPTEFKYNVQKEGIVL